MIEYPVIAAIKALPTITGLGLANVEVDAALTDVGNKQLSISVITETSIPEGMLGASLGRMETKLTVASVSLGFDTLDKFRRDMLGWHSNVNAFQETGAVLDLFSIVLQSLKVEDVVEDETKYFYLTAAFTVEHTGSAADIPVDYT